METVLFSALLRNNEKYIPYMFKIFDQIEEKLSDKYNFQYLVYTNDNHDKTLKILEKYSRKNFDIISEKLDKKILNMGRIERLHILREQLLEKIREKKFNYLFLYDSDIYFNSSIVESLIFNLKNSDYEAVVPNTIAQSNSFYYDLFSLTDKNNTNIDYSNYFRLVNFFKDTVIKKDFEVKSAFGGLFLTSNEKIKDNKISYLDSTKRNECEHKVFNKNFKIGFITDITPIRLKHDKNYKHREIYNIISKNKRDNRSLVAEIFLGLFLITLCFSILYFAIVIKKHRRLLIPLFILVTAFTVIIIVNYSEEIIIFKDF
jgi:hypothetical protein